MTTKTKTTPKFATVDTFALSRPYGTSSHAKRAMVVFAGTHLLSPEEFTLKKIGKGHHYQRTPLAQPETTTKAATNAEVARGVTSPAPKAVACEITNAIKTFNDGIPAALKISPSDRKTAWDKSPPKPTKKIVTTANLKQQETDMANKISIANKKPAKVAKGKKPSTRFDWLAAELKAKAGTLPNAPDMSAPTHKYYRSKMDDLCKLARAGDIKGLQKYDLGEREDGSPALLKRYRALAIAAIKAKA